jgi:hypothetical protein
MKLVQYFLVLCFAMYVLYVIKSAMGINISKRYRAADMPLLMIKAPYKAAKSLSRSLKI